MTQYRQRRKPQIPFDQLVSAGSIPGHSQMNKFGRNPHIDAGDSVEIVWDGGALDYEWPTSASTLSVQSSSASDNSGTTSGGATSVQIYGLNSDWVDYNETVTLNGTGGVDSACYFNRVFRMVVRTAGSDGENLGTVSACGDGFGLAYILPTNNQTLMAMYTIPASKTGYLDSWYAGVSHVSGVSSTRQADMRLHARPSGEVFQVKSSLPVGTDGTSYLEKVYRLRPKYTEKTDVYISGCAANNNTDVTAGFDFLLSDNT